MISTESLHLIALVLMGAADDPTEPERYRDWYKEVLEEVRKEIRLQGDARDTATTA